MKTATAPARYAQKRTSLGVKWSQVRILPSRPNLSRDQQLRKPLGLLCGQLLLSLRRPPTKICPGVLSVVRQGGRVIGAGSFFLRFVVSQVQRFAPRFYRGSPQTVAQMNPLVWGRLVRPAAIYPVGSSVRDSKVFAPVVQPISVPVVDDLPVGGSQHQPVQLVLAPTIFADRVSCAAVQRPCLQREATRRVCVNQRGLVTAAQFLNSSLTAVASASRRVASSQISARNKFGNIYRHFHRQSVTRSFPDVRSNFLRSSHIAALLAALAAPFAVAESMPASPLADLPAGAVKTWAGHRWRRVVEVPAVEVAVERLPLVPAPADNIKSSALQPRVFGHARLFRRSDGSFRCEVRVASDSDDQTLAHELAHCYGWQH